MDIINEAGLYANYFNYFIEHYFLWSLLFICASIFFWRLYRKAHIEDQMKFKKYLYLLLVCFLIFICIFIFNTKKEVDKERKQSHQYLSTHKKYHNVL